MTAPTGHGCTIEGVPRVQAADRPARRARRPRRRAQRPPAVLQNDRLPIGRIDSAPSCRRAVPAPCAVRRDHTAGAARDRADPRSVRGPAGCVYGAHAGHDARTDLGAGAAEGG